MDEMGVKFINTKNCYPKQKGKKRYLFQNAFLIDLNEAIFTFLGTFQSALSVAVCANNRWRQHLV